MPVQGDAAPLPAESLEAALRPFGHSRLLPRLAYVDESVFEWEDATSCGGAGRASASARTSPRVGDQRAEPVGGAGVFLVRAEDGRLRGFANACRHRGHELLRCGESRNLPMVVCPYHSWSYHLDGSLRGAPRFDVWEAFDRDDNGLVELPTEEWHGLVFVAAAGGDPSPLEAHFAGLEELVAAHEPERLARRGPSRLRRRGELEGRHRELPGVLPLRHDPSRAVRGEPPTQRRELPGGEGRRLGGRMDGAARRGRDDVAERQERWDRAARPRLPRGTRGRLSGAVPERALEPAPRLRHDPPAHSGRPPPHPHPLLVGLLPRGPGAARVRPFLRRRLLGPHQPSGLLGVRIGTAGPGVGALGARPARPRRGRRVPVRHHGGEGLPGTARVGGSVGYLAHHQRRGGNR